MTRTKALLLLVFVVLAGAVYADVQVFVIGSNVRSNQQADTRALCAFRRDVQSRYDSGVKFLLSHRRGIPGISAGTIRLSLIAEQHTLAALSSLQC